MARSPLEERLETITRDFVRQIVSALRTASFADVAALDVEPGPAPRSAASRAPRAAVEARLTRISATPSPAARDSGRTRQTADRRAELAERIVKALETAGEPRGVRALSSELGVAPDLLTAPLLELRAAGRIAKHGEKRATTYALA